MNGKTLLPCPFCGSPAEQDYTRAYSTLPEGRLDHGAAIYCTGCNADMMICRADTTELSNEERMFVLAENWNRRPPVDASTPYAAMIEAIQKTRSLVSEAALTGFNCHDGDWAERLFANQAMLSAALSKAGA